MDLIQSQKTTISIRIIDKDKMRAFAKEGEKDWQTFERLVDLIPRDDNNERPND